MFLLIAIATLAVLSAWGMLLEKATNTLVNKLVSLTKTGAGDIEFNACTAARKWSSNSCPIEGPPAAVALALVLQRNAQNVLERILITGRDQMRSL